MKIFKNLFLIFVFIMAIALGISACSKGEQYVRVGFKDESQKYLPIAQKYAVDNNLKIEKYLGMTVIRFNDYRPAPNEREPVIYEWKVANNASGDKFVLQVGPIMPMFPNAKPAIIVSKDRYQVKQ